MTAPALSSPSASKCNTQPSGFNVALLIVMLSWPGLIVPVMAFPFQSSTMNRSLPCTVFPAHVPIHDPLSGWPSCAITGAPAAHNADNARATTNVRIFKLPLGRLFADLEPFELHIQHV